MSHAIDARQQNDTTQLEIDRRRHARHPGRALAELIREADPARKALRVELVDISLSGVGLLAGDLIKTGDKVRVRLRNVVQRFVKEVRGEVRWVRPTSEGQFRLGIELSTPFSATDMQMLKRAGVDLGTETKGVWI
jgi:c-di-GMP-binding flagellar brake protein YcgR